MADKTEVKAAPGAERPAARAEAQKATGTITYNPNLNTWRCVDANGRCVLTIASKELAVAACPTFTIKE